MGRSSCACFSATVLACLFSLHCGAEEALDPGPIEALKTEICARHGFAADLQHLVISGLCARCRQEQSHPVNHVNPV